MSEKKRGTMRGENAEEEEQPGSSTKTTPDKKRRLERPSHRSSIRKGGKDDKTCLPVTCGDKEGNLYRDKLANGEECILSEGYWFTPPGFEKFGGKERSKKWKTSIQSLDTPLLELIQKGELKVPEFHSHRSRETEQGSDSGSSSDRWSPARNLEKGSDSGSSSDCWSPSRNLRKKGELKVPEFHSHRSRETEQGSDSGSSSDRWSPSRNLEKGSDSGSSSDCWSPSRNLRKRRTSPNSMQLTYDISGSSIRKGGKEEKTCLPVTCGDKEGNLYRDKLANGEECILSEGCWFTPSGFEKFGGKERSKKWKTSIQSQDTPLRELIQKGELKVPEFHSHRSRETEQEEQENDDHCSVCGLWGKLLCCDRCPRVFHFACHLPAVKEDMLGQIWLCTFCVLAANQSWMFAAEHSQEQALDSPASAFILQCQYLLLWLYSSDEDRMFSSNPCGAVPRYRKLIQNPMWLDKVGEKLQKRQYFKVGQFVSDIELIFKNSATYNRDNEFGPNGARLKQLFETEFKRVFRVRN